MTSLSPTISSCKRLLIRRLESPSAASSHSPSFVVLKGLLQQRGHCWKNWSVGASISLNCWTPLGSPRGVAEAGRFVGKWVGPSNWNRSVKLGRSSASGGGAGGGAGGGGKEEFRMAAQFSSCESVESAVSAAERSSGVPNAEKGIRVGAIFFDMDDTLVLTHEVDRQAHLVVMELVGVRAPQVDQAAVLRDFLKQFKALAWDPEHKVEVTEWRARLWGKALEGQGVEDMDLARELQNCFDRERLQAFRWTTTVERLVRNLHRQGIKVGIITNGHAQVQRAKLKACNAKELFDTILVGGEEPNEKPHRDIFLKACKIAGCKPEESVMVGDTLKTDIQGGINAGFLSTIWVNVHRTERPLTAVKPDHEIATFPELRQVLKKLGVVFEESE